MQETLNAIQDRISQAWPFRWQALILACIAAAVATVATIAATISSLIAALFLVDRVADVARCGLARGAQIDRPVVGFRKLR